MSGPEKSQSRGETIGDVIDGRYRLTELLGRGGMGSVFRAEHVGIGRPVAVKVLNPELRRYQELNDRLEREAFATGRLTHPHCVEISDSGRLSDGSVYLVMELLEGQPIADELERQGTFELSRALKITRQMVSALGHAHDQGVVHRDLKPENVFLARKGRESDFVKILDFGITKLVGDALIEAGGKQLTQTGITVGTPTYMAPEQLSGGTIDGRTDLYAATIVLFEMLAGRPPMTGSQMEIATQKLTRDPPRLGEVTGRAVPEPVEALIRDGLAREPAGRIEDARIYLARLDALLAETARAAAPPGPAYAGTQAAFAAPVPIQASTPVPIQASTPVPIHTPPPIGRAQTALAGGFRWTRRRLAIAGGAAVLLIVLLFALSGPSQEEHRKALIQELHSGKSCEARRQAVRQLHALGDPKAIPALRRAMKRTRGGVFGAGGKPVNDCLREDARRAIEALQRGR